MIGFPTSLIEQSPPPPLKQWAETDLLSTALVDRRRFFLYFSTTRAGERGTSDCARPTRAFSGRAFPYTINNGVGPGCVSIAPIEGAPPIISPFNRSCVRTQRARKHAQALPHHRRTMMMYQQPLILDPLEVILISHSSPLAFIYFVRGRPSTSNNRDGGFGVQQPQCVEYRL